MYKKYKTEKKIFRRKSGERRYFLELLSNRENKIEELTNIISSNNTKINELLEENASMQKKVYELQRQSDQLNSIHNDLNRLHMKAKADSEDIIDEAKEEAMDALAVTDEINKQVDIFKRDLKFLEKDLSIGTDRLQHRLEKFHNCISEFQYKIQKIKEKFYEKNGIPILEEDRKYTKKNKKRR